jgi:hypothetical protein
MCWQDWFEFGKGPHRRFLDSRDATIAVRSPTTTATASSSSSSRRNCGPRGEFVAGKSSAGRDRVAELTEPVDISTDRTGADLHPFGQF